MSPQEKVLAVLQEGGEATVRALEEYTELDPVVVTAELGKLEASGKITRRPTTTMFGDVVPAWRLA